MILRCRSCARVGAALILFGSTWLASVDVFSARGALAERVEAIGFTVSDMERSIDFFSNVLTFRKIADIETDDPALGVLRRVPPSRARVVRLRLGGELLELTSYRDLPGRPVPPDSRSNDLWFQHVAIIVRDMDAAYARLRAHGVVPISPAPQRLPDWNPAAGGIRAFYFRDPDGHPLEVLQFPAGKGDPKWHMPTDRVFLGIDHTAIVVADTDRSLGFYRDRFGMTVAGTSQNHGPEQERLNDVPGARLRITTLKTGKPGPAIEFLEYLSPRDGRPAPPDARATDLTHWETTVNTRDATEAGRLLRAAQVLFVSPGVVRLGSAFGGRRALLVRDPDGHAVKVVSQ